MSLNRTTSRRETTSRRRTTSRRTTSRRTISGRVMSLNRTTLRRRTTSRRTTSRRTTSRRTTSRRRTPFSQTQARTVVTNLESLLLCLAEKSSHVHITERVLHTEVQRTGSVAYHRDPAAIGFDLPGPRINSHRMPLHTTETSIPGSTHHLHTPLAHITSILNTRSDQNTHDTSSHKIPDPGPMYIM